MNPNELQCDLEPHGGEPEWLVGRSKRIHATDSARILDGDAVKVYADKIVPELAGNSSHRFDIAHEMEPVIGRLYTKRHGGKVHEWPRYTIAVSRDHEWLGATPDGLVESPDRDGPGVFEVKTWSEYDRGSWSDTVPIPIQIQVQHQMVVTGLNWGVIAVAFGFTSLERIVVERNDVFCEAMLKSLAEFWQFVQARREPPTNGLESTTRALARLHPNDNGLAVVLPALVDDLLLELRSMKLDAKQLDAGIREIENELRARIGGNSFGVTPGGQWVSWKSQTRKEYTVPEATFRVLRECKPQKTIEYAPAPMVTSEVANLSEQA